MTSMPATHGHNEACCNIPPVVAKSYEAKGSYEEIGDMRTYVTGPEDATKGILFIMDIFGFTPQTLQGADILAHSDTHNKYKVFISDWFKGEPCPIEWYPPNTDEKKSNLGKFFGKNAPPKAASQVPAVVEAATKAHPSIKSWAVIGFCWGGKVVSLSVKADSNPFKVAAECHPAMVDPADAEGISIPLCMLASKEEPDDAVQKFEKALGGDKHVETFKDQVHGWMAARADLEDERVRGEYTRGYETVLKFFAKHI